MTSKIHNQYQLSNIKDLLPNANNPRSHSPTQVKKLADAIIRFGFTNPILIDEAGSIIAGRQPLGGRCGME